MKTSLTLTATMIFIFTVHLAEATVMYDWTTLQINSGSGGAQEYSLNASLPIDDNEYLAGVFSIPFQELGDIGVTVKFPTGLQFTEFWRPGKFEFMWDFYLMGTLSGDKRTIEALVGYVPEFQNYFTDFAFWESNYDGAVYASAHLLTGGLAIGELWGDWNYSGDWVVRDDTTPVPEPGTFGLLGVGAVVALLCRRRTTHQT